MRRSCGSGGVLSYGQSSSGAIRGSVLIHRSGDRRATVEIANPVSHYQQSVKTNAQGLFSSPHSVQQLSSDGHRFGISERVSGHRCALGVAVEAKVSLQVGVRRPA